MSVDIVMKTEKRDDICVDEGCPQHGKPHICITITPAQKSALLWLRNRNADGMFDINGVLLAAGELAPVMRSTWNKLRSYGLVESYADGKRLRVTASGLSLDLRRVREPIGAGEDA